ncbi:MAG: sulfotransferase [Myxococcales bacterium]|nr:MAG: sulfotransferase [Myxococcales bacterium]
MGWAREAIERLALSLHWTLDRPVVFILGLPRSGTTLVSQYIVHRLEVAYWTNGVGRHPRAPVVTTLLEKRRGPYLSDFRSRYGKVEGSTAPREAGSLWGRFFDLERPTHFDDVSSEAAERLRNLVAATQRVFGGAPFVNKNVKHMLRIDALARIFPESLFLVVRRRMQDAGLSILRARLEAQDPTRWWSVRTPDWEELMALPLEEQVAAQVRGLRRQLGADLDAIPRERVLQLDYERFCRQPDLCLGPLRRMLGALGERNGPAGPFAAVHHVPSDARERRLLALLAEDEARAFSPGTGRSEGS